MKKVLYLTLIVLATGCELKARPKTPAAKQPAPVQPVALPQQPEEKKPEEKKPMGPVFAHKVYNDYLDDPKAARQQYSGHDMLIVGHVWDVDRSGGKVIMFFAVTDYQSGKTDNQGVQAFFAPPVGYGDLERGDRVLIQGRCNGKALGSVNFGNCKFIRKVDPNEFK